MGFLSRYHREVREPLVLPQGSQVSIRVARASSGVLCSHGRGIRPQFAWKGQSQGVSQVAVGSLIPSSCHGDLREPLMLSLGSQESFQVVRGFSGFLLSWCRRLGPHLVLRGESPWVSRVETGNLGFLSSCDGDLKPACVASGKSSLHSSCEGPLGISLQ